MSAADDLRPHADWQKLVDDVQGALDASAPKVAEPVAKK
jgi:hypothetical protein